MEPFSEDIEKMPSTLRILHVTPEMAPFAKQGGLGDVLGALPCALRQLGIDVRVLLPAYPGVLKKIRDLQLPIKKKTKCIHVALNYRVYSAALYQVDFHDVPVYLLEQPDLFTNPDIYPVDINEQTSLPFIFLSLAGLELASVINWNPHVFHVHDWPTASLPSALRWHQYYKEKGVNADTVITIHNLAHQGIVDPTALIGWGFDKSAYTIQGLEFYGQSNLLKGGILAADAITTVSPNYSWDIQTEDGGFGLHGVLSENKHKLRGILNGIDYDIWNPKKDQSIPAPFNRDDLSGKKKCKKKLMELCGWADDNKPLLVFVGRLVEQKGIDILLPALDWLLVENCRMVLVGSGQAYYTDQIQSFAERYRDYFFAYTEFNEDMAHLAYAGGDMLVMPSLFEPCGLSQMISMSYGTVPIVRATGGLADTVIDFDGSADGTGFLFSDYSAEELSDAVFRAIKAYNTPKKWNELVRNCMQADFSWDASAQTYHQLYQALRDGDF